MKRKKTKIMTRNKAVTKKTIEVVLYSNIYEKQFGTNISYNSVSQSLLRWVI